MSVGLGVIHKILGSGLPLSLLEDKGIGRGSFVGNEVKVYDFVKRYLARFGLLPNLTTITAETKVKFPDFPDEPIDYWVQRVEDRRHSNLAMVVSQQMQEAVSKGDADKVRGLAGNLYAQIVSPVVGGRIYNLQAIARDVLDHHDKAQMSAGLSGIPFGLPYLDNISGGAQPADSIVLVGSPSAGKTYLMLQLCLNCFGVGGIPFLGTFEMSALQVVRRMMALRNHVTAMLIRLGKLSHWAREKLEDDTVWLERKKLPFHIFEGGLKTTIDDVVLRVQELKPSAVYVDGAYLLKMPGKMMSIVDRIREVGEILKSMAKEFKIPVFSSYQFNKKGQGLRNIYSGDVIAQLGSIVIGIRDEEDDEEVSREGQHRFDTVQEYKILDLLKGREGERGKIRILFDMARMIIEQDSVLDGYSIPDGSEGGENEQR